MKQRTNCLNTCFLYFVDNKDNFDVLSNTKYLLKVEEFKFLGALFTKYGGLEWELNQQVGVLFTVK